MVTDEQRCPKSKAPVCHVDNLPTDFSHISSVSQLLLKAMDCWQLTFAMWTLSELYTIHSIHTLGKTFNFETVHVSTHSVAFLLN